MIRAYVCVSMCVCVCVCLCVQMFLWSLSPLRLCDIDTHTHTHTHTWRVCDYLLMYKKKKDTSIYIYICMHKYTICDTCLYVCVDVYKCMCICVCLCMCLWLVSVAAQAVCIHFHCGQNWYVLTCTHSAFHIWKHCTHLRNTYAHTRTYTYVRMQTHHTLESRKTVQAACFSKQQLKWGISLCLNTPFRGSCVLYWYSPKLEVRSCLGIVFFKNKWNVFRCNLERWSRQVKPKKDHHISLFSRYLVIWFSLPLSLFLSLSQYIYAYTNTYIYLCVCTQIHICMRLTSWVRKWSAVYIYIYQYVHVSIYIHTCYI